MKKMFKNWILENFSMNVTHNCYRKTRMLSFDNGRKNCMEKMRLASRKYKGKILNYIILDDQMQAVISGSSEQVTDIIRYISSITAADYSLRTNREGPFWKGRYSITLIEKGIHLLRLSLMMDRALIDQEQCLQLGEWKFSGYNDLTGIRKRYVIADACKMAELTGFRNEIEFKEWYVECSAIMSESIPSSIVALNRAAAVGNLDSLERIAERFPRGWSNIEILIEDPKVPTYALYLSEKRRRSFTRSFKN